MATVEGILIFWCIANGVFNVLLCIKRGFPDSLLVKGAIAAIIALFWMVATACVERREQAQYIYIHTSEHIEARPVPAWSDLICGLFSINQATKKGMGVSSFDGSCHIVMKDRLIGNAPKVNNAYVLNVLESTAKTTFTFIRLRQK